MFSRGISAALFFSLCTAPLAWSDATIRLKNHVPTSKLAAAKHLGRLPSTTHLSLVVPLKLTDTAGLDQMLKRIYDPSDSLFGHFMTPDQFNAAYAPSEKDANEVVQYLNRHGLTARSLSNRYLISVEGASSDVEALFQTEIHQYSLNGRKVYAPTIEPSLPTNLASRVGGIIGLNNIAVPRNHLRSRLAGSAFGTGVSGSGLAPADIKKAYSLETSLNGSGQVMGLLEFDGYTASDITAYASNYGLASPKLTNVLIDSFSGTPTKATTADPSPGSLEVTLDIEMFVALAPSAAQILVFEAPNSTNALTTYIDVLNAMTTHNPLPTVISTSWGLPEDGVDDTYFTGESAALKQMAAQGQSFFASAGDNGAYDNTSSSSLVVDSPCSDPYTTCVGGTKLTLSSSGNFQSETSWGQPLNDSGGGGGISAQWPIPAYQAGLATSTNMGLQTPLMRMVPDVSLNAEPDTGYSVYYTSAVAAGQPWNVVGGTSASAPLWAAFTALVNQQRGSLGAIGFMNPSLYQIGASSLYGTTFHDIADFSSNIFFPAVTGYDLSTGWGSFIGVPLLQALSLTTLPPSPPTNLVVTKVTP
jgi:kumamolisin